MPKTDVESKIENLFRKQVQEDKKVKNAYLLVHSDKLGVHMNIAEGKTGDFEAHPAQPNHLASVGKLFTATVMGILQERSELCFGDKISKYLDREIMQGLHVYKGQEYSGDIKISHLLNQSSGLDDVFFPLLKRLIENPERQVTTREAILWGKENLKTRFKPGAKHFYTDTNYFLLGLIVESIIQKPFQQVMHELVFDPLNMKHAYMNDYSTPQVPSPYPTAGIHLYGINFQGYKGIAPLDYSGSSVIAPLEEYLEFMKGLVNHKILKEETLREMLDNALPMGFPAMGFDYGYSIWKVRKIPFLMPAKYYSWGCVGVTGAFMFYHPGTASYIIGTFNDMSYQSKGLRFMLSKVVRQLVAANKNTE